MSDGFLSIMRQSAQGVAGESSEKTIAGAECAASRSASLAGNGFFKKISPMFSPIRFLVGAGPSTLASAQVQTRDDKDPTTVRATHVRTARR
jgi:hypothetical protein